ncbi:uncharacterized protein LOC125947135 [Dermacentor silvarum]|uniref:uncharacterized protein LOC125947135 n=1 Tax=Dermacentor silvarum TaxID=543639 RepID=UPI002100B7B8|nr:uncharacterized protein LOC125947135 [Dermacentor silvarum]
MAPPSRSPDVPTPPSRIPVRSPPASPSQRDLAHAQPGSQPMRHETELIVFFPLPSTFKCTEKGCSTSYSPAVWTSRRQSLQRHLEQQHGCRIVTTTHFCTLCRKILGYRPTSHGCLTKGQHEFSTPTQNQHKCTECPYSFPSRKGLDNHMKAHRRRAAAQQASSANQPASPTTSDDSNVDAPISVATPAPSNEPTPASTPGTPRRGSPNVDSPISVTTTTPAPSKEPTPASTPGTPRRGSPPTMTSTPNLTEAASPSLSEGGDSNAQLLPSPPLQQACANQDTAHDSSASSTASSPEAPMSPAAAEHSDAVSEEADLLSLAGTITDDGVLAKHAKQLRQLQREAVSDSAWLQFTDILEDAIQVVSEAVKLPAASANGKPRRPLNPENAQQIQALYRRNRRRAVRLIVEGETRLCPIPLGELEEHFSETWGPREADTSLLLSKVKRSDMAEVSLAQFTNGEVVSRLRKCENTAPGSDRLTYQHWRTTDPDAVFLTAVFNVCLRYRRTPAAWKESRTVLIHKKGDPGDAANWRPIALGSTISKLYAGCLASRLQEWIASQEVLSRCQKGFLPYDGVYEHNFVLQERLDAARAGGGQLCAAFLDFANAFGSVPHNALIDALHGAGAGADFCAVVADLYRDNKTSIIAEAGTTSPIEISAGIRQGCPLSGLLFNLVLDPVVRALQGGDKQHNVLAYADDLTPLADDPGLLQSRINVAATLSSQLGLRLNPAKCKSLHLSGQTPVGTRPTTFTVYGTPITSIGDFEAHAFLGRPVGFSVLPDRATVDEAISVGRRLLTSMLAPWQRLDAVKTFVFPALNFSMRCGSLGKAEWSRLDTTLRPLIKKTLYLPANAANDYLYGSSAAGAIGIPVAAEISDVCRIDNAFKLLSSADKEVQDLALQALTNVTSKRLRRPADPGDMAAYLSGETEGDFRATATQLQSVWTEARKASRRLGVAWELEEEGPRISRGDVTLGPRKRTKVVRTLRMALAHARNHDLHQKPNQGKVMECVAADRSSSHFLRTGQFTRFADWRFVHRARLNVVPLNAARPWATAVDQRCRVCGSHPETLPHVLCHCMTHSQAYTSRHNQIVNRVKAAASNRFTVTHENRPVGTTNLRPDLVLCRGEEAIIVDVTCPFDNRPAALIEARQKKEEKYKPVQEYLQRKYQKVSVEAIIVGALGSWDPRNDRVMRRFCSKKYLRLFKKLAVSETIAASRNVYADHIAAK